MVFEKILNYIENPFYNCIYHLVLGLLFFILALVLVLENDSSWLVLFDGFFMGIDFYIAYKEYIRWKLLEE